MQRYFTLRSHPECGVTLCITDYSAGIRYLPSASWMSARSFIARRECLCHRSWQILNLFIYCTCHSWRGVNLCPGFHEAEVLYSKTFISAFSQVSWHELNLCAGSQCVERNFCTIIQNAERFSLFFFDGSEVSSFHTFHHLCGPTQRLAEGEIPFQVVRNPPMNWLSTVDRGDDGLEPRTYVHGNNLMRYQGATTSYRRWISSMCRVS